MAKNKKNKKQQTFNVYPYLGGYQHFMRTGGQLPKFEDTGAVVNPNVIKKRMPYNKYSGLRTYEQNQFIPNGSTLGRFANLVDGAIDLGKTVGGVFNKQNWKPGGRYSKYEQPVLNADGTYTGGLKYGRMNFTNTTDENAVLHGDNLAKYMDMSKKEKKNWIESGGRNTDLWWTPDEMTYGKFNYMDLNEDGTPKYDGIQLKASTQRGDILEEETGDRMFSNKTKVLQPDGTYKFVYFDNEGNMLMNQDGTDYDKIEETSGTGGLADANVSNLNIQYDEFGNNAPVSFDQYVEQKDTDGNIKNVEVKGVQYDPTKEYGNFESKEVDEGTTQARIDCETGVTCGGSSGTWTGSQCLCPGDENYRFGGALRRFAEGDETEEELVTPDPYANMVPLEIDTSKNNFNNPLAPPQPPPNITFPPVDPMNNMPVADFAADYPEIPVSESPNVPVISKEALTQQTYDDAGLDNPNVPRIDATEDQQNMGIESNYGDNFAQKATNKIKEATNTGIGGALMDTIVGKAGEETCTCSVKKEDGSEYASKEECEKNGGTYDCKQSKGTGFMSFLFEDAMPIANDIIGQNQRHKDKLFKRSVSAEDMYAASESGVGSGQKGFYDVNKGGYGDDLYGTGKIFGQTAQHGMEMMPQQEPRDYAEALGYKGDDIMLRYNLNMLKDQKAYLGKMNFGGSLPNFLKGGGTGSEGAVLCDAYDKPIQPTNPASKADYSAPKGGDFNEEGAECAIPGTCPGYDDYMYAKYGAELPRYDDGGNWNLKGWLKGEQGFIPDYKGESTKKTISENKSVNKALDYTQTGLTVTGMQDYSGPIAAGADLLNAGISGARAYAAPEGSEQRKVHTENAVLNTTSAIPGYGLATASASLAKDTANYAGITDADKSVTTQVTEAVTDKKQPLVTENRTGNKKIGTTTAKYGKETAEIDMALYYELLRAGADIEIIR